MVYNPFIKIYIPKIIKRRIITQVIIPTLSILIRSAKTTLGAGVFHGGAAAVLASDYLILAAAGAGENYTPFNILNFLFAGKAFFIFHVFNQTLIIYKIYLSETEISFPSS